ncbi:MAG: beta-ketoacyl-ACP synthase II [bacterium]|nr:beta-ketoacyl-ACP synthase II [bacterium]
MMKRVVVTGYSLITPLGLTAETTWANLKAGHSGIDFITRFDTTKYNVKVAAEVKQWEPTRYISPKEVRRMDRFQTFVVAAAQEAVRHSGLTLTDERDRFRTSVVIGSSVGGIEAYFENALELFQTGDPRRISPFGIPMILVDGGSNLMSIELGAYGSSATPISACATGADCIGHAYDMIRLGRLDQALAGCGDAPIIPIGIAAFDRLGACSRESENPAQASRPFSKDRPGLVFAEGAGVLVLESLDRALARGAAIYAEVVGYGSTSDAFHVTAPHPEGSGASAAMQMALDDAGIPASEIDYINAHGTGTGLNDVMETKAIRHVFGDSAYRTPVSSTKSMTGHGMGATAAMEAVFSVLAIRDQVAPPTINLQDPDPECDLDYVPNTARAVPIQYVMSNSFGFGGHNVALIFKAYTA